MYLIHFLYNSFMSILVLYIIFITVLLTSNNLFIYLFFQVLHIVSKCIYCIYNIIDYICHSRVY
jgi:hypothetical protein